MSINRKWLWIGGAAAGAATALALGVPLSTLLIVAALLACPVMMSRGMRGVAHGSGAQQGMGGMGCGPPDDQAPPAQKAVSEQSSAEPAAPSEVARRD